MKRRRRPEAPVPPTRTALELLRERPGGEAGQWLTWGDAQLDARLGGGLARDSGVVEICGQAGSGKTQLACQLAVQSVLPLARGGFGGSAAYISAGEGPLPAQRLAELAGALAEPGEGPDGAAALLARVHTARAAHHEDVVRFLFSHPCLSAARSPT